MYQLSYNILCRQYFLLNVVLLHTLYRQSIVKKKTKTKVNYFYKYFLEDTSLILQNTQESSYLCLYPSWEEGPSESFQMVKTFPQKQTILFLFFPKKALKYIQKRKRSYCKEFPDNKFSITRNICNHRKILTSKKISKIHT